MTLMNAKDTCIIVNQEQYRIILFDQILQQFSSYFVSVIYNKVIILDCFI